VRNEITDWDHADEDILTETASDEVLEAAAGAQRGAVSILVTAGAPYYCCGVG
jgi:hypothetical protein